MNWKNIGEAILWAFLGGAIPSLIEGLSDDHLTYLELKHTLALAVTGALVVLLALLRQMPKGNTDAQKNP